MARVVGRCLILTAHDRLVLAAPVVDIAASQSIRFGSKGDLAIDVTGERHARIGGYDRTECGVFELQSTAGDVDVRASGDVALDGDRVKLNSSTAPSPFTWSSARIP